MSQQSHCGLLCHSCSFICVTLNHNCNLCQTDFMCSNTLNIYRYIYYWFEQYWCIWRWFKVLRGHRVWGGRHWGENHPWPRDEVQSLVPSDRRCIFHFFVAQRVIDDGGDETTQHPLNKQRCSGRFKVAGRLIQMHSAKPWVFRIPAARAATAQRSRLAFWTRTPPHTALSLMVLQVWPQTEMSSIYITPSTYSAQCYSSVGRAVQTRCVRCV